MDTLYISDLDGTLVNNDAEISDSSLQELIDDGLQFTVASTRSVVSMRQMLKEQVVCMTVIHRKEVLDDLEQHIIDSHGEHVEVHHYENQYDPGWHWLTGGKTTCSRNYWQQ